MSNATVTYRFEELVGAVNAVLPHASKDDVTPVITGIRFDAEGALAATDRYTVGAYKPEHVLVDADDAATFDGFTLDRAGCVWLSKLRVAMLSGGKFLAPYYVIRLQVEDGLVTASVHPGGFDSADGGKFTTPLSPAEQTASFSTISGNYPPVVRLFPDAEKLASREAMNMPVSLKTEFLVRIDKATKALGERGNGVARFQFMSTDNPNKPGPAYVTVGDRFRALIQPNLMLR